MTLQHEELKRKEKEQQLAKMNALGKSLVILKTSHHRICYLGKVLPIAGASPKAS